MLKRYEHISEKHARSIIKISVLTAFILVAH